MTVWKSESATNASRHPDILLSTARKFLSGETSLETVVFCNHDDETCRIFQERAGTLGREASWHPVPVCQNTCKTAFSEGSAYATNSSSYKLTCGIMESRVKPRSSFSPGRGAARHPGEKGVEHWSY